MSAKADTSGRMQLDLSDVDKRVGLPVGGGQAWEPCSATDIRRWVHALDYPNPIHWNQELAAQSKFGGIVAPQSFTVCMDFAHGVQPACVGRIPGSHLIFGGEEWWFYGPRIRPGDRLVQERKFDGYKVTDTKFAGPTMFSRGDTLHRNQHGVLIAKERATAIRYLAAEAEKRQLYNPNTAPIKRWTKQELQQIENDRYAWVLSNRHGVSPRFADVKVGDQLPRRVLGPHSISSFTQEYRAFMFDPWGTWYWKIPDIEDPWTDQEAGWLDGWTCDYEAAKIDPRRRDGLLFGPSKGHINSDAAGEVGMFRAYGYGATMGGWFHDYVAYWAGNDGYIWHSKSQFRGPSFEGDITLFTGSVIAKNPESAWGMPTVTVKVKLANQDGVPLVEALAEVELPA
jgi:N-terminal half of MaoC dehydratase